jgi:nucleotide-binding universal stress UspA family protein
MRSILLHANEDEGFEARLQVALDLSREFGAHLTAAYTVSFEPVVTGDFYASAVAPTLPLAREQAELAQGRMEKRLGREDVGWDWETLIGRPEDVLLERATLADMVILGTSGSMGEGTPSDLVALLAIEGRTPVLAVPEEYRFFDASASVVIAWNGSPQAANALRSARPLLARAGAVYLVIIEEEGRKPANFDLSPSAAAQYLSRSGVGAEIVSIPCDRNRVADTLVEAAQTREASCLVLGAYGHSRLRQRLFGGVTRTILSDVRLPLLLAH